MNSFDSITSGIKSLSQNVDRWQTELKQPMWKGQAKKANHPETEKKLKTKLKNAEVKMAQLIKDLENLQKPSFDIPQIDFKATVDENPRAIPNPNGNAQPAEKKLDDAQQIRILEELGTVRPLLNAPKSDKPEYAAIKDLILSPEFVRNPGLLFDNLSSNEDLEKKLKDLRFVTHPDKNIACKDEAEAIYKFVEFVYNILKD